MSEGKMTKVANQSGIYYRDSDTKRYHGKIDKCFYLTFKDGEKKIWEKAGWLSEGYSAQAAASIRAERIRALRHGDELPQKKNQEITFGKLWEYYDKWLDTGKAFPENDRIRYANHLKDRFSSKRISQMTPLELEQLKIDLLKKKLAPATVKHVLVLIRQIINKAIIWNLWKGENPIKKIKLPKLNNRRERFLSQEEAGSVLQKLKQVSQQVYEMALMSLCTGMRAGEIFALKWGHCDFKNGVIHIADPKSGESRKSYMTNTITTMLKAKQQGTPGELVFKGDNGEQIKEISKSFRETIDLLELNNGIDDPRQRVCFHSLRHTFASWLALKGTPILTIKELLGHKSITMTERYAHLSPDHKRAAALGIDNMIKKAQKEINANNQSVKEITKKKKIESKNITNKKRSVGININK